MGEISYTRNGVTQTITLEDSQLAGWLAAQHPVNNVIALDFEGSGLHVDGNWASDASKCEPEARISCVPMAWREWIKDICPPCYANNVGVPVGGPHEEGCLGDGSYERLELCTAVIPFDQGMVGGKKGRYIKNVTQKTPVLGWETIPHTETCCDALKGCVCAPWNFGAFGWQALVGWWQSAAVSRIHFFNAKFDLWMALAGLRNGAHVACEPSCSGWQHSTNPRCPNAGTDLSAKLGRDVMIFEAIRDPIEKVSLDNVARKFFQERKDQGMDEGLKANGVGLGKRYDLVAWPITAKYAAKDAELTLRAVEYEDALEDAGEIDKQDFPIIEREHQKIITLWNMERAGVPFDVELCREQAAKMHEEVEKLVKDLPFTDNSIAAGKYFFESPDDGGLGLLPIKLTEKGKPSCDAEVVARLTKEKGTAGEVARLWQHIANMKSVCSKWYDSWPERAGADRRLRTSFWQCSVESDRKDKISGGAISGRLSATRVQLQGVPQDWRVPKHIVGVKKLMRTDSPDYELWELDASNAEVRVTAWLTQCQALADVINSGVNIHSANTVNIFGQMLAESWPGGWPQGQAFDVMDIDPVTNEVRRDKDGDPVYVLMAHPDWTKVRTSMKRGIFGTIYASGVGTLKSQIDNDLKDDIPLRQISAFMAELNAAYPEIKRTSKACEWKVDRAKGGPGFVRLVSGRRRVFGDGERTYKALNACVQGGVSEAMSVLMVDVGHTYPGIVRNQVHDSLWLMIHKDLVSTVVPDVQRRGKELFERLFSTPKMHIDFKFDSKRLA